MQKKQAGHAHVKMRENPKNGFSTNKQFFNQSFGEHFYLSSTWMQGIRVKLCVITTLLKISCG